MIRASRKLAILFSALAASGCGGVRTPPAMSEVSGRVTVGGRTPVRLIMNLTPVTPGVGREEECVVEKGAYRTTVIAGRYKVSFTPCPGSPSIPKKYQPPAETGLELDGSAAAAKDFELK